MRQQELEGIEIFEGILAANLTRNAELVSIGDGFVKSPAAAADKGNANRQALASRPTISIAQAVALAAANLGGTALESEISVSEPPTRSDLRQVLKSARLAGPAYGQLVWLPMNEDAMRSIDFSNFPVKL